MVFFNGPYGFKIFKGCIPQILPWFILEYFVPFARASLAELWVMK